MPEKKLQSISKAVVWPCCPKASNCSKIRHTVYATLRVSLSVHEVRFTGRHALEVCLSNRHSEFAHLLEEHIIAYSGQHSRWTSQAAYTGMSIAKARAAPHFQELLY